MSPAQSSLLVTMQDAIRGTHHGMLIRSAHHGLTTTMPAIMILGIAHGMILGTLGMILGMMDITLVTMAITVIMDIHATTVTTMELTTLLITLLPTIHVLQVRTTMDISVTIRLVEYGIMVMPFLTHMARLEARA